MPRERTLADDRQTLLTRLTSARRATDDLFRILRPEALYERPIPERHRLIFYLGHLEAFDWNLLHGPLGGKPFQPELDRLFAFGIDPVDGGLPNEPASDWPSERAVRDYGERTRAELDDRLREADPAVPGFADGTLLHVAIEHRLMHAETLAYLFHQLDPALKQPPRAPDPEPPGRPSGGAATVRIPSGAATLGLSRGTAFGWDNEFEEQRAEVPGFDIDAHKVTNGEYLEFVRSGGYGDRKFWSEPDWDWKERQRLRHPRFWNGEEGAYGYRGMFGSRPLPLDCPVYVSHAEASAYSRWAGKALPTEAQWHRAAFGTPGGTEQAHPWGEAPPTPDRGNFDFNRWEPAPTGSYPAGRSAFGVHDLLGNGWEWTRSLFKPLPGFEPFPFYPGYSANFFDGEHYVIKGGSPRTAACFLRRSFRNWFQPRYGYIYAGFRLVAA